MAQNSQTLSAVALVTSPSLTFAVASGVPYIFQYRLPWDSTSQTVGARVGLYFPAVISCSISVKMSAGADGVNTNQIGTISFSGDQVVGPSAATNQNNFLEIDGALMCSGSGVLQVAYGAEVATASSGIVFRQGGAGIMWAFA